MASSPSIIAFVVNTQWCASPRLAAIVREQRKASQHTSWHNVEKISNWEKTDIQMSVWECFTGDERRVRSSFYRFFFCSVLYVPAKMSCKLWLNVWTCRSFTCPFTLRNLDRNPTAALISGFIVPLAQRVCIEKATALRKRCVVPPSSFVCCLSERLAPLLLCLMALVLSFSWHLLVEVAGCCLAGEKPVGYNENTSFLL